MFVLAYTLFIFPCERDPLTYTPLPGLSSPCPVIVHPSYRPYLGCRPRAPLSYTPPTAPTWVVLPVPRYRTPLLPPLPGLSSPCPVNAHPSYRPYLGCRPRAPLTHTPPTAPTWVVLPVPRYRTPLLPPLPGLSSPCPVIVHPTYRPYLGCRPRAPLTYTPPTAPTWVVVPVPRYRTPLLPPLPGLSSPCPVNVHPSYRPYLGCRPRAPLSYTPPTAPTWVVVPVPR